MITSSNEYPDFLKPRQRIESAIVEFLSAEGQLEIQDWLQRYPDLTTELMEFLENQRMIGSLVDPWRPEPERQSDFPTCRIGHYEILDVIDRGGMGVVYKARPVEGGPVVALKMIQQERCSSMEARERFRNEAEAAARLKHPHFVTIHEVGEHQGIPYFSMDYIEGQTLAERIEGGPVSQRRALKIIYTIARAIDFAHSSSILHRDLKPSNILIDHDGKVHITDFGLAKQLDAGHTVTETGQILGSIDYMPPEQAQANHNLIGPASDVYSIGAILYELLTGRPPFQGTSVWEILRQIRQDCPQPPSQLNPQIDPELDRICLKCLEKKPSKRYLSAIHLARDVGNVLKKMASSPQEFQAEENSPKRRGFLAVSSDSALVASACLTPILLVCMFLFGQFSDSSEAPDRQIASLESAQQPTAQIEKTGTPALVEISEEAPAPGPAHNQPFSIVEAQPPEEVNPVAPVNAERELEEEQPVVPEQGITCESIAYSGTPFGIGKISFKIPADDDWRWYPDLPARVFSRSNNVWYNSFEYTEPEDTENAALFTAWFLFHNAENLSLTVSAGERVLTENHPVIVQPRSVEQSPVVLEEWWKAFNKNHASSVSEELRPVNDYFLEMLARRLDLKLVARVIGGEQTSALERQFERSVGMLFGFESVLKSMMELPPLPRDAYQQTATLPLPQPLTIRSIRFDPRLARGEPDALSRKVPPECFYFRFSRVENYRWIRGLIKGWGGSMDEIVATPAVDSEVRDRIERQLAFDPDLAIEAGIDNEIEDCALIGLDTYFHEGAAVGVLFQTKPGSRLRNIILEQRERFAESQGAMHRTVDINQIEVPFLSTDDFRIRSFYVTQGDFHLITNSQTLAAKYLLTSRRGRSIGELPEYLYARNKYLETSKNYTGVLYLPDPFFRNITSPEYRIEVERRRHAAREIQKLELALAAAKAEGANFQSTDDLIAHGFLPEEFGQRPDHSRPIVANDGTVFDSHRGCPGTLCPIPDLSVSRVTRAEIDAYEDFKRAYRREWRAVDPVLLSFTESEDTRSNKRKVLIDVHITPYAQEEYGFLQRVFSRSPGNLRLAMVEGELLGLSASLQNSNLKAQAHFGLVDDEVDWEIRDGKIIRRGAFSHSTFAERNSYTHVTPFNTQVMSLLSDLSQTLQNRDSEVPAQTPRSTSAGETTSAPTTFLVFATDFVTLGLSRSLFRFMSPSISEGSSKLRQIPVNREKLVYTRTSKIRRLVDETGRLEHGERPAHMVMRLNDVSQSKVAEYIRAYTFVSSRRLSAENVACLNRLTADLNLTPEKSRTLLEQVIEAKLQCPASGEIQVNFGEDPRVAHWKSSSWTKPTLYQESDVPGNYKFGFLEWLRGLTLESTLHTASRTLHSRLELELHETRADTILAGGEKPVEVAQRPVNPPPKIDEILISNRSDRDVKYRCRRLQGVWSKWYTITPDQDHQFDMKETMQIEYESRLQLKRTTVNVGSHMEFVTPRTTQTEPQLRSVSP